MRQIVLDTETTGLEPEAGHRVIEIGCVELVNRRQSGRTFHQYLNPQRDIDEGALSVHGIDREFLADKPLFGDVVDDFLEFVDEAELIIHNAPFDMGFINHELVLCGHARRDLAERCTILDTLTLARDRHPGQRNSLDALCKRYDVDNSNRSLHGALLDAQILADVYLAMTGGQVILSLSDDDAAQAAGTAATQRPVERPAGPLVVRPASDAERTAHRRMLAAIARSRDGQCLWSRIVDGPGDESA